MSNSANADPFSPFGVGPDVALVHTRKLGVALVRLENRLADIGREIPATLLREHDPLKDITKGVRNAVFDIVDDIRKVRAELAQALGNAHVEYEAGREQTREEAQAVRDRDAVDAARADSVAKICEPPAQEGQGTEAPALRRAGHQTEGGAL